MSPFPASVQTEEPASTGTTRTAKVLIVGGGFSGIGLAHRLRQSGIDDVVILEAASDVGGVWQSNTFPGATCDVPSHLYSFSFAPNPEWTSTYSPQPEIRRYLQDCIDRFGLRLKLRTGVEVEAAAWDEADQCWRVSTSEGEWAAQFLVSAVGPLTEPKLPNVPGIERFRGKLMHSARWDHGYDLTGKRVASIGTGASAIQYVPHVAQQAGHLFVFQRTPAWVMPHDKRPITDVERARFRRHPLRQRLARAQVYASKEALVLAFAKRSALMKKAEGVPMGHLEAQVAEPELRRLLTPDYRLGCKRILLSNDWYPALQRRNVTLVPKALREIREDTVVDSDGVERDVDCIIFGTGFKVAEIPFADRVRGRSGRLLHDAWGQRPRAYLGASVPDFPNYFMMLGPNTGSGHTSVVYLAEAQMEHIVLAVKAMQERGASSMEVTREAVEVFNRDVDDKLEGTVWETGNCTSFYRDATGRNAAIWPDWTWRFRWLARRSPRKAYAFTTAASRVNDPSTAATR